jgi:hypothetical protein
LNFRPPDETTPEYRYTSKTYKGNDLAFNKYSTDPIINEESVINSKSPKKYLKSDFNQEQRFKDHPIYCKANGESVFTGPGSYNA